MFQVHTQLKFYTMFVLEYRKGNLPSLPWNTNIHLLEKW